MEIHPAYRKRLAQMLDDITHQRSVSPQPDAVVVCAEEQGMSLSASLRRADHVVIEAGFQAAADSTQQGLLEALCQVMESKPIQECADHAAIYVERMLRDPAEAPLVRGLVTPDNADPQLAMIQSLVRKLLAAYRATSGYGQTSNFFDRPVSPAWKALSEGQRMERVRKVLEDHAMTRLVTLLGMEGLKRVVVQFVAEMDNLAKHDLLVKLDELLRMAVEPTLQTVSRVRSDTNVVRIAEKKKTS